MAGFRPPLDISQYIAKVGGYGVLGGGAHQAPPEIQEENRRAAEAFAEQLASTPQRMGSGPAACSTCTDLVTASDCTVVWDVNGYYRALGIPAPYRGITKTTLRLAYLAVHGEQSVRVTRIFKLLLDPEFRRDYDRAPLGQQYLDEITQDDLKLRALREAALRSRHGRKVTKEEILDDWGLKLVPESDEDSADPQGNSVSAARHTAANPTEGEHWLQWSWGYYLWRSKSRQTARLAEWQALLIKQFADRETRMRFCIGFHGSKASPSPWVTAVSGPHLVIFLNEDAEPTDELAANAAAFVLDEHTDETVRKALPSMSAPNFSRGGAGAKERAKAQQNFAKTRFLTLEDGETAILRFVDDSDDWIHTLQHQFVPTKAAPADYPKDQKWPTRMGAVCRHDEAFAAMYKDCFICDNMRDEEKDKPYKPALRLWARACVRKPVLGTEEMVEAGQIPKKKIGQRVGLKDSEVDVPELNEKGEPTGKMVREKEVIIINMGMKNFFGPLQGAYEIYGTVLDRDFAVTRDGKGTETDYSIVPLNEIPNADGSIFTLEDDDVRAKYTKVIDLVKYVTEQASDERYARYFDTTKKAPSRKKDGEGGTKAKARAAAAEEPDEDETPVTAEKNDIDQAALAAMRARVRTTSGGAKAKAKPQEEVDAEADEAEAAGAEDDEVVNFNVG